MTDKPDLAHAPFFALRDHHVIALEGRDALAFAQAQAMNDLTTLADGQWQWNGWLTPKGRVIALFAVLRVAPDTLWLVVPNTDPAELAARLQRFVFRSKVRIASRDDLHASGDFQTPALAHAAQAATQGATWELDLSAEDGARTLRIGTEPVAEDLAAQARWRAFDLAHGLPRLDDSQQEHWTPQQLSLDRLRAFSVKKGCYPGQEIVARTHFLGQAKRGLALLRVGASARAGDAVQEDGSDAGSLVSVAAADDNGALALAVLPLAHATLGGLTVAGEAASLAALKPGLAR